MRPRRTVLRCKSSYRVKMLTPSADIDFPVVSVNEVDLSGVMPAPPQPSVPTAATTSSSSLSYDELVRVARPLDLLLFRGTDAVSGMISRLQKCRLGDGSFTHVGIVVTSDLWAHPNIVPGQLYVWESTMSMSCFGLTDGVPDVEHSRGRFGVQIRSLRAVVQSYAGTVNWAPLRSNPFADEELRPFVREQFRKIQTQYGDATYDASMLELFSAMFPPLRWMRNTARWCRTCGGCRKESEWVFCSEGVAMIYQSVGVIESKFAPRDVVPMDFLGKDEDGLPVLVDAPQRIRNE